MPSRLRAPARVALLSGFLFGLPVSFLVGLPLPARGADTAAAPIQPAWIWGPEPTTSYRLVKKFTGPADVLPVS